MGVVVRAAAVPPLLVYKELNMVDIGNMLDGISANKVSAEKDFVIVVSAARDCMLATEVYDASRSLNLCQRAYDRMLALYERSKLVYARATNLCMGRDIDYVRGLDTVAAWETCKHMERVCFFASQHLDTARRHCLSMKRQ